MDVYIQPTRVSQGLASGQTAKSLRNIARLWIPIKVARYTELTIRWTIPYNASIGLMHPHIETRFVLGP